MISKTNLARYSAVAAGVFFAIIALAAIGASAQEQLVRDGKLQLCPHKTMDQLTRGFIGAAKWTSRRITQDKVTVAVEGDVTWHGSPAKLMLGFAVDEKAGTFSYEELKINGESQPRLVGNGIFMKMCAQAK